MPTATTPSSTLRTFVSFSELAEDILHMSRARVYELIERGALPQPIYDIRTRRPLFDERLQQQALTVRQTGVGIDGSPVIFYRRERLIPQSTTTPASRRRRTSIRPVPRYTQIVDALQGLGVRHADEESVTNAMAECFPQGIEQQDESDVLRTLFRHLRCPQTA